MGLDQSYNTLFTRSQNYLDYNLDHDPEDVPVYMGQSFFNTQSASHCCSLFSHC